MGGINITDRHNSTSKKRKQSTGESYESSASEAETQQSTWPTLHVSRFLVIKTLEENRTMADLSLVVIEKSIQSTAGHPEIV